MRKLFRLVSQAFVAVVMLGLSAACDGSAKGNATASKDAATAANSPDAGTGSHTSDFDAGHARTDGGKSQDAGHAHDVPDAAVRHDAGTRVIDSGTTSDEDASGEPVAGSCADCPAHTHCIQDHCVCDEGYTESDEDAGANACTRMWTRHLGSPGDDAARAIAIDSSGNLLVAGYTTGAFDGSTNAGGQDLLVVKYDSTGALQWTRQFGSTTSEVANAVATDANGNVYAGGSTTGGPGASFDAVIVKYDANGTEEWTHQFGSNADDVVNGVATDTSGNVYAAGYTTGAFDGNTNAGGNDLFVIKYDGAGQRQWTQQLGSNSNDYAYAITVDASGNLFVVGFTTGRLDGDEVDAPGGKLFIVKYDGAGQKLWARQYGTVDKVIISDEGALAVAADPSGNIVAAGQVILHGSGSSVSNDALTVKYDAAGEEQWAQTLSSAREAAKGVQTDSSGNVYVAGSTTGSFDGRPATGIDMFLAKYDSAGEKQWTKQLHNPDADDAAYGLAIDANGDLFIAGTTSGAIDGYANAGSNDLVIVKYDSAGNRI